MKSPLKKSIGEVVTDYGTKVMRILKKRLQRSLFDFYGDVKADNLRTREAVNAPTTPVDGDGGVIYTKAADGKLYYKSNEVSEVELSAADTVLTTEQVQDIAGALIATGGTKTNITVTYDDDNNNMDFVVASDLNTTGTAGGLSSTLVVSSGGTGATTFTSGQILRGNGTSALTADNNLKFDGNTFSVTSSTSARPMVVISNTNSDAEAPLLVFDRTSTTGSDNDDIGKIEFSAEDDVGNGPHIYAQIRSTIIDASDTAEEGRLILSVASHDAELQPGLKMQSGDAEDEVDVTVGNGTTSLTTIAGDLGISGGNITTAVEVDGLLTSGANMRVGGSGRTSNNWITIDAQSGNDTSGGGICFYETGIDTLGSPQYGAKIVYNETTDEFAIGTMHNTVFNRQIYMKRQYDRVYLADAAFIEGTTPGLILSDTSTTVSDGDTLGQLTFNNADDGSSTLNIKGIATEDHASGANGGSKLEFYVTPNTTSALALAATIDQNKDLTIEGNLVGNRKIAISSGTDGNVNGGDIVYFGGTTSMTIGRIYHYKSDGTWEIANADAVATCDGLLGVALGSASDTHGVLLRGMVTLDHDPGAVGDVLYVQSDNAGTTGHATATAPSASGDCVRVVGYCVHASAGNVWFNPDSTFVEVA